MGKAVNWSRRGEYTAKRNLTPAMADEAIADIEAVVIDPDYNGKTNEGVRTIGYSTTAGAVLTVITYEENGTTYGANAWKSNGATAATTDREALMSDRLDKKLARIAQEAEAAEADQTDRPLPPGTKVSRPNLARSKVLQVRLNPEEFAAVERLADARGLPPSTVAREKLLELLDTDDSGLDVTGQMVAAAARITELAALLDHQQAT